MPEDWAWWLRNFRAHDSCIGWPLPGEGVPEADAAFDGPGGYPKPAEPMAASGGGS